MHVNPSVRIAARPTPCGRTGGAILAAILLALAMAAAPAPVTAQQSGTFDMSVAGIRAGTLRYEGGEAGGRYDVRGGVRSSGLIGAFFDVRIDTTAEGRVTGSRYRPGSYSEVFTDDEETVRRTFRYAAGVPRITRDPPRSKPPKHGAPAAEQAGTVDPMTAAWVILRDREASEVCTLDLPLYDGIRRTRLILDAALRAEDGLTCRGRYVRVAGFSPEQMAERRVWPVEIDYARLEGGTLRVREVRFPTSFGAARLTRR